MDRSEFFEKIKLLHEYKVGNKYFFLRNFKIVEGMIISVEFESKIDNYKNLTQKNYLKITLIQDESKVQCYPSELFKTKEDAACEFLKANDVPAELLRVLKPVKPDTTAGRLLELISAVDPSIDLGELFWPVVKKISGTLVNEETTSDYWDCECDKEYIHLAEEEDCKICGKRKEECPDSRVRELKPENMHKG